MGWSDFAFGSLAGMFPGTLLLVILGTLTDFAAERSGQHAGPLGTALLAIGVIIALLATWVVMRVARRVLESHREKSPPA